MANLIPFFNLISVLFAASAILLVISKRVNPAKINARFIIAGGLILVSIGLLNFLDFSYSSLSFDGEKSLMVLTFLAIFIFGIYYSFTEHKLRQQEQAELTIQKSNDQLTGIFDSIPVLLILYDKRTKTVQVNQEFEKRLGWSSEELQDRNIIDTFIENPTDNKRAYEDVRSFKGIWNEFPISAKNGTIRYQQWARVALDENISIGIGIDIHEQKETEQALEAEQRRFELISKSTNDVLYDWDLKNDKAWWSRGWETQFGFPKEKIGRNYLWLSSIIHPEDLENLNSHFEQVKRSNHKHWFHEYRIVNPAGDIIHVWDKGYFIRDKIGKATGLIGALVNITEEKKAQLVLEESEEKYKLLFNKSPLPMCIYDPESLEIIEMNDAACDLYGFKKEEIASLEILDLFAPEEHEQVFENIKKYTNRISPSLEWKHRTRQGEPLIVQVKGAQISYFGNTYRLAIIKDISQQREAEEKVFASFVEGEDRERKRLARELHDGIGQYLTAVNMNLDAMKSSISNLPEKEQKLFGHGMDYLKKAMMETRSISHNLMPSVVEDHGLTSAVKNLTDSFEESSEIKISYFENIGKCSFNPKVEINVYRIVQECLNNIQKHSKADKVDVQLIIDDLDLIVSIEDNGIGFDTTSENYEAGIGLNSIKTRTFVMGGILDIETKKNEGTLITISIPIAKTEGSHEQD